MNSIKDKLSFIPVFVLAVVPLFYLAKGVSGIVQFEGDPTPTITVTPKPAYEISYCSDEEKEIAFVPEHIVIENADIDLPVLSVPLENGTWKVNAKVANFAEGTSLINPVSGNVGIFAHNRRPGFLGIQDVAEGSSIEVYGGNYQAVYRVSKTALATPSDVDVFYPTEDSSLTLVTCDGTFSERRYILSAKLISIKEKCN